MKIDKVILFTILLLVFTIGIASATLNVYPVTAISDTKIIPKMNMGGYTSGTSIQMNMCPGEIRSSSFVVNSTSAINSFTVIKNNSLKSIK